MEYKDGIYLVQENGSKVPFTGKNSVKECMDCKYIGLKLGEKAICIALRDAAKDSTSLTSAEDMTKGYGNYIDSYIDATADWNGKKNTEHLKQIGLSKNIYLKDGEYIPSVGELKFIQSFRKQVQEALGFVDGKLLPHEWYWTSTEKNRSNAWSMFISDGYVGDWLAKATYYGNVRAVKEF